MRGVLSRGLLYMKSYIKEKLINYYSSIDCRWIIPWQWVNWEKFPFLVLLLQLVRLPQLHASKDNPLEHTVYHTDTADKWRSWPPLSCPRDAQSGTQDDCIRGRTDRQPLPDANTDRLD